MNKDTLDIKGRKVGPAYPPYIIAEMSANHNGSLERAFLLLEQAHRAGADAVKIQTYRPDTITLPSSEPDFQITDGLWKGRTLYDLYEWAHTPWEWHKPLFDRARELGLTLFSSPFDDTAVDLLEDLNAPAYKIASFEAIDLALIRRVSETGKPVLISTGMANADEIGEAVETARDAGCSQLLVLHCVSGYPALASDYNLKTLPDMAKRFNVLTGLSDHTLGNATAIASIALGACLIEKHFTLDRNGGGPDDSFSLEPADMRALCEDTEMAWQALGRVNYERTESERGNLKFRRSLYYVKDLSAGETITADSIRSVRPGYGVAPKYRDALIGRRVKHPIKQFTAVRMDDLVPFE
ncbi:MAG: pseudaminic acid synthase [Saccharospirillum sp.]